MLPSEYCDWVVSLPKLGPPTLPFGLPADMGLAHSMNASLDSDLLRLEAVIRFDSLPAPLVAQTERNMVLASYDIDT